jgi:hypothetical protein
MQPTQAPRSARSSTESWSSATTSVIPILPPGFRTRNVSANTAGLSVESLTTQSEMTTSTVTGAGDDLDLAQRQRDYHHVNGLRIYAEPR